MKTWQKYIITIVPLLIVGSILYYFSDIVTYIILAWVVSMIGAPIYRLFHRFVKSGIAAGLTLVVLTLALTIMLRLFLPPLFDQARRLAGVDYENIIVGLQEPIKDLQKWLGDKGFFSQLVEDKTKHKHDIDGSHYLKTEIIRLDSLVYEKKDSLQRPINLIVNVTNDNLHKDGGHDPPSSNYFEGLRSNIFEMFNPSKIQEMLTSLFTFFGGFVITILSVFFIAFFFLKEQGLFTKIVSIPVDDKYEAKVEHAIEESSTLLIRYFVGLVLQVIIITLVTSIILKVLGFKSALLMAFSFAILNLIPYLGPLLGNFVGVLIVISSNLEVDFYTMMLPKIIKAIIVFAVVQLLDNFLLQPNIFSKSVKAHPLEIFIIVLMGAKLGGVVGMVLAIPAYTIIRVLAKVFLSEFQVVKRITRNMT
jgi:predicted PurR-regulated permease PerM